MFETRPAACSLSSKKILCLRGSCCKKAFKPEWITQIAARDIVADEMLMFDTDHDTKDLAKLKEPFLRQ